MSLLLVKSVLHPGVTEILIKRYECKNVLNCSVLQICKQLYGLKFHL